MTPAVTVLVPAHDDAPFLDDALASLAAQSFTDFEAIVADDASGDATPEIARSWAARDARFRCSRVDVNLGMSANWNRALSEARGMHVLKLDGDDAMAPRALELLHAEHAIEPRLQFSACRSLDCDADLTPRGPYRGDEALLRHGLDPLSRHLRPGLEWLRLCFDDIQLWTSCALLFRRTELVELGGWDARWTASDTDLILRALARNRPVAHVPEAGVLYRRRAGGASHRARASGTSRLEAGMIALHGLDANRRHLRPWGRALRQNWWRLWRRFERDARDDRLWSAVPEARIEELRELARRTWKMRPPLGVRIEGDVRQLLWRLRRQTTESS